MGVAENCSCWPPFKRRGEPVPCPLRFQKVLPQTPSCPVFLRGADIISLTQVLLPLGVYSVLFYKTHFTSSTSRKNLLVDTCSTFSGLPGSSVVKNLPAMQGLQKMGVQSWGWKIPWRRKWQPTSVFLPGQSPWTGAWQATVHGVTRVRHG